MPSNIASPSSYLWIFQGSVALSKYEPTDQPLFLLDLMVLVRTLFASDEALLIPFPFLPAPLMCSGSREKLFERDYHSKIKKKTFLFQAQKKNLLMLYKYKKALTFT